MRTVLTAALLAVATGACLPSPSNPVPVRGDAASLEGHWSGEYNSLESHRSGLIAFTLEVGQDTAQGDVLMIPAVSYPVTYATQYLPDETSRQSPRPLRIQLVRVFGRQVAGQLLPYTDPECGCTVSTIFSGRLSGDRLEGVFHSYHPDGHTVTGEWRVKRQ